MSSHLIYTFVVVGVVVWTGIVSWRDIIAIKIQDLSSVPFALRTPTFQQTFAHFTISDSVILPLDFEEFNSVLMILCVWGQTNSLIRSRKLNMYITLFVRFYSFTHRPKHCQIARHRSDAGVNRRFAHVQTTRHRQTSLMDVNYRWSPQKVTFTQRLVYTEQKHRHRSSCPKIHVDLRRHVWCENNAIYFIWIQSTERDDDVSSLRSGHSDININSVTAARNGTQVSHSVQVWGTSFEKLLEDAAGLHTFAIFLQKEFSAENIYFWTACERYRKMLDHAERVKEANAIFSKHLAVGASEPVNVDSRARTMAQDRLNYADQDLFLPVSYWNSPVFQRQTFSLFDIFTVSTK